MHHAFRTLLPALIVCAGSAGLAHADDTKADRAAALERLEQARIAFEAAKAELEAAQREAAAVTGGQIQTGPLEKGRFAICPLHRYFFDPSTGKAEGVTCRPAKRYRTRVDGDADLRPVTRFDREGRGILRRACALLLMAVAEERFPQLQLAVGQSLLGGHF